MDFIDNPLYIEALIKELKYLINNDTSIKKGKKNVLLGILDDYNNNLIPLNEILKIFGNPYQTRL